MVSNENQNFHHRLHDTHRQFLHPLVSLCPQLLVVSLLCELLLELLDLAHDLLPLKELDLHIPRTTHNEDDERWEVRIVALAKIGWLPCGTGPRTSSPAPARPSVLSEQAKATTMS